MSNGLGAVTGGEPIPREQWLFERYYLNSQLVLVFRCGMQGCGYFNDRIRKSMKWHFVISHPGVKAFWNETCVTVDELAKQRRLNQK